MENKMFKQKIENKSSVPLHGLKAGGQLDIEVDKEGTPLDKHWRRRLRDKSIEIVKQEKPAKKIETKTAKGDKS
jgi:hypothetical protein